MDDMPAVDRKVFFRLLVEQMKKEKEAQEEAQEGGGGKDTLLRKPMTPNEVYGKTDLEKQSPRYASRFVQGQQLKADYETRKTEAAAQGPARREK